MADDLQPLLLEMQKTNALTKELLAEKKLDDTPQQLLAGNIFEILNAQNLFAKEKDLIEKSFGTKDKEYVGGVLVDRADQQAAVFDTILKGIEVFREGFVMVEERLKEENQSLMKSALDKANESDQLVMETFALQMQDQQARADFFSGVITDVGKIVTKGIEQIAPTPSKEREKEKDEKAKEKNFLQKLGGYFAEPLTGLKESFDDLTEGFLGKAGLATVLVLFVSGLLSVFKPAADVLAAVISGIGNFFGDLGKVFSGDMSFSDFFFNNIVGMTVSVLLPFSKTFRKFLGFFVKILTRFIAVPLLFINAALGFFEEVNKSFSDFANNPTFGGFLDLLISPIRGIALGLIDGLKGLLVGAIELLVPDEYVASVTEFVTNIIDSIRAFFATLLSPTKLFNFVKNLFTGDEEPEGMAMGGPVAAGTPYIVGEKGPELFVPGAAGGIMPGLGGGNIVVNNNQVNQSAQTANHQHSNVTIVDRQQEQTGL